MSIKMPIILNSQVVSDPVSKECVVIDSVMDFVYAAGSTS